MRDGLIARREERGISREILALITGIPLATYIQVEAGETDVLYPDWLNIVHALRLPAGCIDELRNDLKNIVCEHPDCPIVIAKLDKRGMVQINSCYSVCERCEGEFCSRHIGRENHVCGKAVKWWRD